ncbi:hypothetical protein Nepgr_022251 [Nepenthes gracilis]|uniref:Xyloglucan endotransglucosylase/hydrolase n=1 Tax=Nepenthes gracilis TaxID=150966 RepID=A0AAD3T096_NEPGR|nr:hypothetical protein Nepgr_022251 [Nepenthes gracilis]
MEFYCSIYLSAVLFVALLTCSRGAQQPSFDQNYQIIWGYDHVARFDGGSRIQLSIDRSSGSGFRSKLEYFTGFFGMRLKLPPKSAGVATTYYFISNAPRGVLHEELDFEFLGDKILQTNIFINGVGKREQRIRFWFDPTADFHTYKILRNPHIIVYFVDDIPIRVFKNSTKYGLPYPSQPMHIEATMWNAEGWAGGPVNWSNGPFKAQYEGFGIHGCGSGYGPLGCAAPVLPWNRKGLHQLSEEQQRAYQQVKKKYVFYDYCYDKKRRPEFPIECKLN